MDATVKNFWKAWIDYFKKGDSEAMLLHIEKLLIARTDERAWKIMNKRQKAELLNSYFMDLADYLNEDYITPLMKKKRRRK